VRFTTSIITRKTTFILSFLLLVSIGVAAQQTQSTEGTAFEPPRFEFSAQGAGFFIENSNSHGLQGRVTKSGGFLLGSRVRINRWLAVDTQSGFERSTQIYSGATVARVQANVLQFTPAPVVRIPLTGRIQPFALVGGGVLIFDPTGKAGGTFPGAKRQSKGAFVYGGGADYVLSKHLAFRTEFRALVYRIPNFHLNSLNLGGRTAFFEPSAGIVFRF
jgi:opacity protein-like surface antigen